MKQLLPHAMNHLVILHSLTVFGNSDSFPCLSRGRGINFFGRGGRGGGWGGGWMKLRGRRGGCLL